MFPVVGSYAPPPKGFQRIAGNPIIALGDVGSWKQNTLNEPCIVDDPLDSTMYLMFYSGVRADGQARIGRATALKTAPTVWTEYDGNPVISDADRRVDTVINIGGILTAFCTVNDGSGITRLTSSDGGFTFENQGLALTATGQGRNDGTVVQQGAVMVDTDGTWRMYYSYRSGVAILPGIRYATSSDGITWTKQGAGDIYSVGPAGSYDSTYIEWHSVKKFGSTYVIAYEGYNGTAWRIQFLLSSDPASGWKRSPVMFNPSEVGVLDRYHVATPSLDLLGGEWYLTYQGGGTNPSYMANAWVLMMAKLNCDPLAIL